MTSITSAFFQLITRFIWCPKIRSIIQFHSMVKQDLKFLFPNEKENVELEVMKHEKTNHYLLIILQKIIVVKTNH